MTGVASPALPPIFDLPILKERVPRFFLTHYWIPVVSPECCTSEAPTSITLYVNPAVGCLGG
jgi:hypothetical protein